MVVGRRHLIGPNVIGIFEEVLYFLAREIHHIEHIFIFHEVEHIAHEYVALGDGGIERKGSGERDIGA